MRTHSLAVASFALLALAACDGEFSAAHEVEPNDDVLHATVLQDDSELVVEGTCRDSADRDYFKVTAVPGTFKSALAWKDGEFEIAFNPESGVTATAVLVSDESPIELETAVDGIGETEIVFAVDCNPAGPSLPQGLDYRLDLTVPR